MAAKDAWSVVVTTVALLIDGVLQERVMTRHWGTAEQTGVIPLLCIPGAEQQAADGSCAAVVHSAVCGQSFLPAAPIKAYCMVSASNMVSTLCQY